MRKKMKKWMFLSITLLSILVLTACGSKADKSSKKQLLLATNSGKATEQFIALQEIAETYNSQQDKVEVEVSFLNDYEPTMKTKMAANDLPDLFFTHGWSLTRYSEYLEPLESEKWVDKISPFVKDRITSKDGKIYVLPLDISLGGIMFNEKILADLNIDWHSIKTWNDFIDVCEIVKKSGKTPIALGGTKDSWTIANYMDFVLPTFLVTNEKENYRVELLDGSFDWENIEPFYNHFTELYDKGYFNDDVQEGTNQDAIDSFAANEVAFRFDISSFIKEVNRISPDLGVGFMPIPTMSKEDEPITITGEGIAIGAWKDSENKKEAVEFLDYLSQPENINKVAASDVFPTGLVGDGYQSDLGSLTPYIDEAEKYRAFGYFDRDYLPSGMWDTMINVGEGIINKTSDKKDVIRIFQADYDKLIKQ